MEDLEQERKRICLIDSQPSRKRNCLMSQQVEVVNVIPSSSSEPPVVAGTLDKVKEELVGRIDDGCSSSVLGDNMNMGIDGAYKPHDDDDLLQKKNINKYTTRPPPPRRSSSPTSSCEGCITERYSICHGSSTPAAPEIIMSDPKIYDVMREIDNFFKRDDVWRDIDNIFKRHDENLISRMLETFQREGKILKRLPSGGKLLTTEEWMGKIRAREGM